MSVLPQLILSFARLDEGLHFKISNHQLDLWLIDAVGAFYVAAFRAVFVLDRFLKSTV